MRRRRRSSRLAPAALIAVSALVAAGCGLKPAAEASISASQTAAQQGSQTAGSAVLPGVTSGDPAAVDPAGDGSGDPAAVATDPSAAAVDPATGTDPAAVAGGSPAIGTGSSGSDGSGGIGLPAPVAAVPGTGTGGTTGTSGTAAVPGTTTASGTAKPTVKSSTSAKPTTATTTKKPTTTTTAKAGGSSTGGSTGGTTGSTGTGGTGTGAATAPTGTRTGIDDAAKTIRITIHSPITGATPTRSTAYNDAALNLFWKDPAHKVFGYQVIFDAVDDQYTPQTARPVCEDASRRSFMVLGGGGTDQIQACGSDPVLAQSHTPYASAGVTTNGLAGLSNYFAISPAYKDQARASLALAKNEGADLTRCAIVTTETANFDDATSSAEAAFGPACGTVKVFRTDKSGSLQAGQAAGQAIAGYAPTTAYEVVAPTFWVGVVLGLQSSGITSGLQWTGPGLTIGLNSVASSVCTNAPGTKVAVLSPFPGLERAPAVFNAAGPSSDPAQADIAFSTYSSAELLYRVLTSVGSINALNRENVITALSQFSGGGFSISPDVNFPAGGGHFGGTATWGLKADCGKKVFVTERATPYGN